MAVNKSQANTAVRDATTGLKAEVKDYGGESRLLVQTSSTPGGTATAPSFSNKYFVDYSRSNINLPSGGATIYSYTGSGKFEHIWMELEEEDIEIEFIIDGVQSFRIDMNVWEDSGGDGRDLSANLPMYFDREKDTFYFYPRFPIEFSSSIEFKGYSSSNEDVRGWVVSHTKES